jgi:hypothetical protein
MSTSRCAGYGRCSCAAWRVNTASSGVVDVANSSAGRTVYYRAHTRFMLEAWRVDFNTSCPHSRLGWMTPSAYAEVRRSGWLKALRLIDLRSAAQTPHLGDESEWRRTADAKPPRGAAVNDEKRTHVQLTLHDLKIVDQFICYSYRGLEALPCHTVLVQAIGKYDCRSDTLKLNGRPLDLDNIQIKAVSTKEDCLKSHARAECISIYMIDSVFVRFVDLLRKNTEPGETVMRLDAQPHNRYPDVISLVFNGVATTRYVGAISGSNARSPMHSDREDRPNFKFVDVISADGMSLPT